MLQRIARWVKILGAVVLVPSAGAADLSPAHWPVSERAELQQHELLAFPSNAGIVKGHTSLVAGTLSPIAVHAGVEVLRRGGNAADAAATVAFTQIATDLGSVVSYAGVTSLLYYEAKSHKVYALDAGWGNYAHETDASTIPATDVTVITGQTPTAGAGGSGALGRQTLVGGFMAGIQALHQRFGRLKFADLFQPAIWYAENGVPISPVTEAWFRSRQTQLWRTPAGHRFASMPDGSLPKVGDLFRQPDLARTLKAVAKDGAAYMYTGEWARQFVDAIRAEGGRAELDDLARYKPVWRDPLSVQFGGATVYGPGEDSTEACAVLETLNLLSALHIEELGPYWHDPAAFKDYAYALRFAQYGHYLPQVTAFEDSHGFKSDCKTRLTLQYAAAVAPALTSLLGPTNAPVESGHHSDSVVVVDRWGNVAALVHSINAITWGDTGIVVGGIPIADSAAINKAMLLKLKPGERLPDSMSPVIALQDGKPVLAVACVGSSLVPETVRLVAGELPKGQDLQSLMSAPPLVLNFDPFEPTVSLAQRAEVIPAGAYDAQLLQSFAARGVAVREESRARIQVTRGSAVMAVIDPADGAPTSVEVPTVVGFAESDIQRGAPVPPRQSRM